MTGESAEATGETITALDLSWLRSELAAHSPVDRSGADDPDAGRWVCLCDPLVTTDLP